MTALSSSSAHSFDANGIRLVVHDWGGVGAPILLAHPTGFHGRIWAPVAEQLVTHGRHVWSFDFRGHGDSDAPDLDYSWHGFADDVARCGASISGLPAIPALVACGHSKGGAALILGEQQRPATFARIWAYEPIIFASEQPLPPQEDFFLARAARKRRNEWHSTEEAFAAYAIEATVERHDSRRHCARTWSTDSATAATECSN